MLIKLDKVFELHGFFQNFTNNFNMFFLNQLLKVINLLPNKKFEILFNSLEYRIIKTLESFQK